MDLTKPVQNATEDAVDTVYNDAIEAFRSPWLVNILKTKHEPVIGAIDASLFHLPDDDALPAELVGSVDTSFSQDCTPIIHAFLHVNTGATCFVTNQQNELHRPVPTSSTCSTAQSGPRTIINTLGTFVLDLVTSNGSTIPIKAHQTPEIRRFQRRSMSTHALQGFGYNVEHSLLSTGNVLCIRQIGAHQWHTIPLVTVGKADFIKVRIHRPAVAGVTNFTGHIRLSLPSLLPALILSPNSKGFLS
jgi:hypothetical protein